MPKYRKLHTKFWHDPTVKNLEERETLIFLYLISSPHSNMIGWYHCPPSYISTDTPYPYEGVLKGLKTLRKRGLIEYDEKHEMVLIRNFLKYNQISGKNQLKGATNQIEELPSKSLIDPFMECLEQIYGKDSDIFEAVDDLLNELENKGLPRGYEGGSARDTDTNTDTNTDNNTNTNNTNSESDDSDVLPNKYSGGDIEKEARDLTEWFCNEINEIAEKVDTPEEGTERFQKWMVAFCRIEEHDGFSWDEIKNTLKWGLKDSFWNDKIRSATGLRKRSDRNEQRKIVNIYESMKSDKEDTNGKTDSRSRYGASSDSRKEALKRREEQDSDVPF